MADSDKTLVSVTHLVKHFPIKSGVVFQTQVGAVKAVADKAAA